MKVVINMLLPLMLALTCSLDTFAASFAYTTNKIKLSFKYICIINLICSSMLGISLYFGELITGLIPNDLARNLSFILLTLLGIRYVYQSLLKIYVHKKPDFQKIFHFKHVAFQCELTISGIQETNEITQIPLDFKEAVYLAFALSLDSLTIGITSALTSMNIPLIFLLSLLTNWIFMGLGIYLGKKFTEKSEMNLTWLSGLILISLAFLKVR